MRKRDPKFKTLLVLSLICLIIIPNPINPDNLSELIQFGNSTSLVSHFDDSMQNYEDNGSRNNLLMLDKISFGSSRYGIKTEKCPNGGSPQYLLTGQIKWCKLDDECQPLYECVVIIGLSHFGESIRYCCPTRASACMEKPARFSSKSNRSRYLSALEHCKSSATKTFYFDNRRLKCLERLDMPECPVLSQFSSLTHFDKSLNHFRTLAECREKCESTACKLGESVYLREESNYEEPLLCNISKDCPLGYVCRPDKLLNRKICCGYINFEPCPSGFGAFIIPFTGRAKKCTMNLVRDDCPNPHLCIKNNVDQNSYCCMKKDGLCQHGQQPYIHPLTDQTIKCNPNNYIAACPPGYMCTGAISDLTWGYCCSELIVANCPEGSTSLINRFTNQPQPCLMGDDSCGKHFFCNEINQNEGVCCSRIIRNENEIKKLPMPKLVNQTKKNESKTISNLNTTQTENAELEAYSTVIPEEIPKSKSVTIDNNSLITEGQSVAPENESALNGSEENSIRVTATSADNNEDDNVEDSEIILELPEELDERDSKQKINVDVDLDKFALKIVQQIKQSKNNNWSKGEEVEEEEIHEKVQKRRNECGELIQLELEQTGKETKTSTFESATERELQEIERKIDKLIAKKPKSSDINAEASNKSKNEANSSEEEETTFKRKTIDKKKEKMKNKILPLRIARKLRCPKKFIPMTYPGSKFLLHCSIESKLKSSEMTDKSSSQIHDGSEEEQSNDCPGSSICLYAIGDSSKSICCIPESIVSNENNSKSDNQKKLKKTKNKHGRKNVPYVQVHVKTELSENERRKLESREKLGGEVEKISVAREKLQRKVKHRGKLEERVKDNSIDKEDLSEDGKEEFPDGSNFSLIASTDSTCPTVIADRTCIPRLMDTCIESGFFCHFNREMKNFMCCSLRRMREIKD